MLIETTYFCARFYSVGQLGETDLVSYLRTHALMYEYYRQALEISPPHIGEDLRRLFSSKAFQIVNARYLIYRQTSNT